MSQRTVTINGTVYDAHTGLPLSTAPQNVQSSVPPPTQVKQQPHSQAVHASPQKSQTLNRQVVQKTASPFSGQPTATKHSVQKSPMVTKFAPHPAGITKDHRKINDIGPVAHPMVTKAHQQQTARTTPAQTLAPKPSQVIKQEAIAEAMEKAPKNNQKEKANKKPRKFQRFASISSVALALLLLGGYFTYLNMPNLSVRVAAASAGVNATYPEYRPDGYSLSGAVAYSQGQVSMKFASNSGPQNFTILQSKSNWDSSAVLDNYVKQKAGENYITYNERGLTIYTYGSNAAWVNGGVLYTINGDAPLSSDQIRRIATSL